MGIAYIAHYSKTAKAYGLAVFYCLNTDRGGCIMVLMNTALLLIFTIFSLVSFIAILWGADPYSASPLVRTLFFVTLFFSLMGLFSLLGIWISKLFKGPRSLGVIFRRGSLLSLLTVSIVLLETFSALNMINALSILLVIIVIEMIAIYKNNGRHR